MRIEDLMRVSHVKRWQIVRVGREQTLAEHLYRVFLLVREFGPKVGLTSEDQSAAEQFALVHDLPEIMTGDVASPVKSMLPPIDHIEATFTRQHIDAMAACTRKSLKLVKLCDLIEAAVFLEVEGIGQHASDVEDSIIEKIKEIIAAEGWNDISQSVADLIWSQ